MARFYAYLAMSRQAVWQKVRTASKWLETERVIIKQVESLRVFHPAMGARKIYAKWSADPENQHLVAHLGRDKFEDILISNGLKIRRLSSGHRTTFSGLLHFPNLIAGKSYTDINHVWSSDLTYYWIEGAWVYITIIMDVYSRYCLAAVLSRTRTTEDTTLPALKVALKQRGIAKYDDLTLHSDGGGQYYATNFVKSLRDYNIKSSMGLSCYENPFSERINSTIKNEYLLPKKPLTYDALVKELKRTVYLYNNDRPHQSLNYLTPAAFEASLLKTLEKDPIPLKIVPIIQR